MADRRLRTKPLGLFPDRRALQYYDHMVEVLRVYHYGQRTEEANVQWIRRCVEFQQHWYPEPLSVGDVNHFLTHLAVRDHAVPTQNEAISAILFLYKRVRAQSLDRIDRVARANCPKRLPFVLTVDEVSPILTRISGDESLIAMLLYDGELQLLEALCLRGKDFDFGCGDTVREGKGRNDGVITMLCAVLSPLQKHIPRAHAIYQQDLADGYRLVEMPRALAHKHPTANREWRRQFLQERRCRNAQMGELGRHHIDESLFQRSLKVPVRKVRLTKLVTNCTFRCTFRSTWGGNGCGICPVQEPLGQKNIRTTTIYTHVLPRGGSSVRSPADGVAHSVAGWNNKRKHLSRETQLHDEATNVYSSPCSWRQSSHWNATFRRQSSMLTILNQILHPNQLP